MVKLNNLVGSEAFRCHSLMGNKTEIIDTGACPEPKNADKAHNATVIRTLTSLDLYSDEANKSESCRESPRTCLTISIFLDAGLPSFSLDLVSSFTADSTLKPRSVHTHLFSYGG